MNFAEPRHKGPLHHHIWTMERVIEREREEERNTGRRREKKGRKNEKGQKKMSGCVTRVCEVKKMKKKIVVAHAKGFTGKNCQLMTTSGPYIYSTTERAKEERERE